MQNEIWKDVPGFPGYQVSNAGRVRSLPRIVKRGNHTMSISGSILRFGTSMGYSFVNLRKDGKSISVKVHKLVGLVFVENPKNRPEIDHINTNRKDNRPENLRWVNRHENNMNPITRERMSNIKRKIK
jgi:hypothetical protein